MTKREIVIEEALIKLEVKFLATGEHFDSSRENMISLISWTEGKAKQIYSMKAGETENLDWNGEAFLIPTGSKKLICMAMKDSWDGEYPKPKDLIIITDGDSIAVI